MSELIGRIAVVLYPGANFCSSAVRCPTPCPMLAAVHKTSVYLDDEQADAAAGPLLRGTARWPAASTFISAMIPGFWRCLTKRGRGRRRPAPGIPAS